MWLLRNLSCEIMTHNTAGDFQCEENVFHTANERENLVFLSRAMGTWAEKMSEGVKRVTWTLVMCIM